MEKGTVVKLNAALTNAKIYYTTDGSTPLETSTLYVNGITLNKSVEIKAITISAEGQTSDVARFVYTVISDEDQILKVETKTAAKGQSVSVPIMVANNPGIALIGFNVNYNKDVMTLTSATLGDIFTGELDCNLESVPFVFNAYTGSANKTESGTLVTLQFTIHDDCAEGDYDITLTDVESLNIDEDPVEFICVNGKISVKISIPGDVTGDGKVTRSDLLRLAKHFSGFTVELDEAAADVTGDGKVTRSDLLRLAKHFSGFDVVLGN